MTPTPSAPELREQAKAALDAGDLSRARRCIADAVFAAADAGDQADDERSYVERLRDEIPARWRLERVATSSLTHNQQRSEGLLPVPEPGSVLVWGFGRGITLLAPQTSRSTPLEGSAPEFAPRRAVFDPSGDRALLWNERESQLVDLRGERIVGSIPSGTGTFLCGGFDYAGRTRLVSREGPAVKVQPGGAAAALPGASGALYRRAPDDALVFCDAGVVPLALPHAAAGRPWPAPHAQGLDGARAWLSPEGLVLAARRAGGSVLLDGEGRLLRSYPWTPDAASFFPDGRFVAVQEGDMPPRIVDLASGETAAAPAMPADAGPPRLGGVSFDGDRLYVLTGGKVPGLAVYPLRLTVHHGFAARPFVKLLANGLDGPGVVKARADEWAAQAAVRDAKRAAEEEAASLRKAEADANLREARERVERSEKAQAGAQAAPAALPAPAAVPAPGGPPGAVEPPEKILERAETSMRRGRLTEALAAAQAAIALSAGDPAISRRARRMRVEIPSNWRIARLFGVALSAKLPLAGCAEPAGLTLSPDPQRCEALVWGRGWMSFAALDGGAVAPVAGVPAGLLPTQVAWHPAGGQLLVADGKVALTVLVAARRIGETQEAPKTGFAGILYAADGTALLLEPADLEGGRLPGGGAVSRVVYTYAPRGEELRAFVADAVNSLSIPSLLPSGSWTYQDSHGLDPERAWVSPDGLLLACRRSGGAVLLDRQGVLRRESALTFDRAAFAPDGRFVVTQLGHAAPRVVDLNTGLAVGDLTPPAGAGPVTLGGVTCDGTRAVVIEGGATPRLLVYEPDWDEIWQSNGGSFADYLQLGHDPKKIDELRWSELEAHEAGVTQMYRSWTKMKRATPEQKEAYKRVQKAKKLRAALPRPRTEVERQATAEWKSKDDVLVEARRAGAEPALDALARHGFRPRGAPAKEKDLAALEKRVKAPLPPSARALLAVLAGGPLEAGHARLRFHDLDALVLAQSKAAPLSSKKLEGLVLFAEETRELPGLPRTAFLLDAAGRLGRGAWTVFGLEHAPKPDPVDAVFVAPDLESFVRRALATPTLCDGPSLRYSPELTA